MRKPLTPEEIAALVRLVKRISAQNEILREADWQRRTARAAARLEAERIAIAVDVDVAIERERDRLPN